MRDGSIAGGKIGSRILNFNSFCMLLKVKIYGIFFSLQILENPSYLSCTLQEI